MATLLMALVGPSTGWPTFAEALPWRHKARVCPDAITL
jgi:hypothetical protein